MSRFAGIRARDGDPAYLMGYNSSMRNAYALLGVLFLIIILGAAYAFDRKNKNFTEQSRTDGITNETQTSQTAMALSLTSTAFEQGGTIPSKYTCDGDRSVSPPLRISGVPSEAKSLALIMDDPDVPKQLHPDGVYDHWVVFDIPPADGAPNIPEGGPVPGTHGANGAGKDAYTGPCPPPQYEPSEHRYVFRAYALDAELSLRRGATKKEVLDAMQGHILEQAELVGRYKRIAQ